MARPVHRSGDTAHLAAEAHPGEAVLSARRQPQGRFFAICSVLLAEFVIAPSVARPSTERIVLAAGSERFAKEEEHFGFGCFRQVARNNMPHHRPIAITMTLQYFSVPSSCNMSIPNLPYEVALLKNG